MSIKAPDETISGMSTGGPDSDPLGLLRVSSLIAALAGTAGSVGLTLYAGHRLHAPRLLQLLFSMWVLSPFVALALVSMVSKRWPVLTRRTFYSLMLILAVASLVIYSVVAFGTPRPKTAIFVVVPPASCLLIAIVPLAALVSRKLSRRRDDA
jgi:hypothetical protein